MINRIWKSFYARYRGFAPLSCLESPHADILRGYRRWRWLTKQRRGGKEIDPSVRVRFKAEKLDDCLLLGKGVQLDRGVNLWIANECEPNQGSMELSENVYVGPNSFLGSCHRLSIGRDSMIGANCYLTTVNHVTERIDVPFAKQGYRGGDVTLGENVWLGSNVVVLPGVAIGDHAVIGAGAVVTRNVPQCETWGGAPAKMISRREDTGSTESKQ